MTKTPASCSMSDLAHARRTLGGFLALIIAVVPWPAIGDSQTPEQLWQQSEFQAAADAIAATVAPEGAGVSWSERNARSESLDTWKNRFREKGQLRLLLDALLRIDPDDAISRLERLDLESDPLDVKFTGELERLLQTPKERYPFRSKVRRNQTRFQDYFDIAYRLMRLYEKQRELDKLCALGLKLAHEEPPFKGWWRIPPETVPFEESEPQHINACLALTIQYADAQTLAELESCLPKQTWVSARAQIARRTSKEAAQPSRPAVGWANLPKDVSAWVCGDTVLSLACDDKYIYAGMPWGVAIYDHDGQPITRVALAAAVDDLAVADDTLWAATEKGLYCVVCDAWTVTTLPLDTHRPEVQRQDIASRYGDKAGSATSVAYDGRYLWIGTPQGVQRYEPSTRNLVAYEAKGVPASGGQFYFDGPYVWCGCSRYDAPSDTWKAITLEEKPVQVLAVNNGVVWGAVQVSQQMGERPCIVMRDTLTVTTLLIESSAPYYTENQGEFKYRGTWENKPVFNEYYFDFWAGLLRKLPVSIRTVDSVRYDVREMSQPSDERFVDAVKRGVARLSNGTWVVGARVDDLSRQPPFSDLRDPRDSSEKPFGLFLVPKDKPPVRVSSFVSGDSLPGDMVMGAVLPPARRQWVYTGKGLAAFDETRGVFAHYRQAEGLCADRVTGGVSTDDRDYFATGYGKDRGGLALYDSHTGVFTALFRSDGLASNKLAGLERQDNALRIIYDIQSPSDSSNGFSAASLDLRTGTITPEGGGQSMPQSEKLDTLAPAAKKASEKKPVPFLGGWVTFEQTIGGKTYMGGTRGLLILTEPSAQTAALAVESIVPVVVQSAEEGRRRTEQNTRFFITSPEDLAAYLMDPYPDVRAKALASIPWVYPQRTVPGRREAIFVDKPYLPVLFKATEDSDPCVRGTALAQILAAVDTPESTPALKSLLSDPERVIREAAAMELARRGEKVPSALILSALEDPAFSLPFGPQGSRQFKCDNMEVYRYVAPHADADIFDVLLKHPPSYFANDYKTTVFVPLGASLRNHPDAAQVLLRAKNDPNSPDGYDRGIQGPNRAFAAQVFQSAGKEMLPLLHDALKSDEPLVRANAACACGAINDPSSIPYLAGLFAYKDKLTMEGLRSGLGDSDSPDAPPLLARLFAQCDKDTELLRKQYNEWSSSAQYYMASRDRREMEKGGALLNQLRQFLRPEDFLDTNYFNPLKQPQAFFRALAATDSTYGRLDAARRLADAQGDDVPKNVAALKPLLVGSQQAARIAAAVSLVKLDDPAGQKPILDALQTHDDAELRKVLSELHRVKEPALLSFAREQIDRILGDANLPEETRSAAMDLLQKN